MQETAQHSDSRRLACAVRPEKSENLSLAGLEVDVVHGTEIAEALYEILYDH
jgi:hypothetical protein